MDDITNEPGASIRSSRIGAVKMIGSPDQIAKLFAALASAQGAFKTIDNNKVAKITAREGKQGYTYHYANMAKILEDVRPALSANGLTLVQPLASTEAVTRVTSDGSKSVRSVTFLTTILAHKDGGAMFTEIEVDTGSGGDIKEVGKRISYMRRYAAMPILGIANDDADDDEADEGGDGGHHRRQPVQAPSGIPRELAAAETVAELTRVYRALPQEERAAHSEWFNSRSAELSTK